ncbi:MAG: GHKL domain-containing protein, partial [Lachnospiraceae bacterium]|nr:GHKL domain-containing protein [Lachnospiraceae bacterium]
DKGSVSVKLSSGSRGKGANIIVSNTYAEGKDLDTSRFFERFYREDESHNSEKAGFGIGLSMAREITERMKGKIKVTYAGDMIYFTVEL